VTIQDARSFLLEFKMAATGGSGIDVIPRAETRSALAQLGLTMANLEEILLGLSATNYCRGPVSDRDRAGDIWVFWMRHRGMRVLYQVESSTGRRKADCKMYLVSSREVSAEVPTQVKGA